MNEILNNLYYKEYNFDGANSLYEKAKKINPKLTLTIVREWLKKQSTSQFFTRKLEKRILTYLLRNTEQLSNRSHVFSKIQKAK